MKKTVACFLTLALFASCGFWGPSQTPVYLDETDGVFFTPNGSGLYKSGSLEEMTFAASGEEGANGAAGDGSSASPVEPDVYWLDEEGNRLYTANSWRGLLAFDISTRATPTLLARQAVIGRPKELYAHDGDIVLLTDPSGYSGPIYSVEMAGAAGSAASALSAAKSAVTVMPRSAFGAGADLDRAEPFRAEIGGSIVDSRLVGDSLVVATSEGWYAALGAGSGSASGSSGTADALAGTASSAIGSWRAALHIVDLSAASPSVSTYQVEGDCTAIHVASDAVFVALRSGDWGSDRSTVLRFDFAADGSLKRAGSVEVPGYVSDRFKMDWKEGWLRLVTHEYRNWSDQSTAAFAVDWRDPAAPVSHRDGGLVLASGESLYASRFDGNFAYVVTFLQKDPLFVVSFADPAKPAKLGELVIPGYSTHLEPFAGAGGERLLFAVGVEGGQSKVAVFDVSDPSSPLQKGTLALGDSWSWSSANGDWKRVNRLAGLGAFAVPYYEYDYRAGGGGFKVALVSAGASGASLLCELPDSGDTERTIAAGPDLVYAYAADRLQAWRVGTDPPTLTAEVPIVEDVAWAGEIGGVGVKLVRSGDKVSARSFDPVDFASTASIARLELPSLDDSGTSLRYELDAGAILPLPDSRRLLVLGRGWSEARAEKAIVLSIAVGADSSLAFDHGTVEVSSSAVWGPPPCDSGARFAGLAGGKVILFHGGVSVIDPAAWPAAAEISAINGMTAFAYGDEVALFTWTDSQREGYGLVDASIWDVSGAAPARLSGPSSFPGVPLGRTKGGTWIGAYEPASWLEESRILAVRLGEGPAVLLGETELEGRVSASAAFGEGLALLAGPGLRYWYYDEVMPATATASSGSMWLRATRRAVARGSGGTNLVSVTAESGAPVLLSVGSLAGWSGLLADGLDSAGAPALVAAGTRGALVCRPSASGFESTKTLAYTSGEAWWLPGLSVSGAALWVSRSMAGIERFALE